MQRVTDCLRALVTVASALLLVCFLAVGTSAQSIASAPPLETVLQIELKPCPDPCVIDLISGESASQAFDDLLLTVGVAGGIAKLPDQSERYAYAFDPKGRKVTHFLNAITAAEPQYRWTRTDDVLNLIPVQEPTLLTTVISEFSAKDANVWELLEVLKRNPDFLAACKRLNLVERTPLRASDVIWGGGGKVAQPTMLISLRLQHLTIRQILNEIVKRDGTWHYYEFSRGDRTFGFDLDIGNYYTGPQLKR
jgi:hypothetical protein